MIYMGLVVDTVYGEPSIEPKETSGFRAWTRISTKKIYSDEVTIGRGMFAFNRMIQKFKESNFEAMNAWKALV